MQLIADEYNETSKEILEGYGIKLIERENKKHVFLHAKNKNLSKIFTELGYMDYKNILKRRNGTEKNQTQRITGRGCKGIMVPVEYEPKPIKENSVVEAPIWTIKK
jgi:hypothetical protein